MPENGAQPDIRLFSYAGSRRRHLAGADQLDHGMDNAFAAAAGALAAAIFLDIIAYIRIGIPCPAMLALRTSLHRHTLWHRQILPYS